MYIATELYSIFWWLEIEKLIIWNSCLVGDFTKKLVTTMDGMPYYGFMFYSIILWLHDITVRKIVNGKNYKEIIKLILIWFRRKGISLIYINYRMGWLIPIYVYANKINMTVACCYHENNMKMTTSELFVQFGHMLTTGAQYVD